MPSFSSWRSRRSRWASSPGPENSRLRSTAEMEPVNREEASPAVVSGVYPVPGASSSAEP